MPMFGCLRAQDKDPKRRDADPESESESDASKGDASEDETTKQETKIELAKKTFEDRLKNLDSLFKNNQTLVDAAIQQHQGKGSGMVIGPNEDGEAQGKGNYVHAKSVSSYPKKPRYANFVIVLLQILPPPLSLSLWWFQNCTSRCYLHKCQID